jgi:hypothetical protein
MPTYETADLKVPVDFTYHVEGDKTKDLVKCQAMVHFPSLEKLLLAGGESVTRKMQTIGRKHGFPVGRRVDVDHEGKFTKTSEEKAIDAVTAANEEELVAMMELVKAKLTAMKKASK